jgi:3-hydroxybutyryl-CoA dehydrogenase
LLEDGITSIEENDLEMNLGANHPMGPLQLADLIGLDVVLKIYKEINPFPPVSGILEKKVSLNKLGRKTGEGFYIYNKKNPL